MIRTETRDWTKRLHLSTCLSVRNTREKDRESEGDRQTKKERDRERVRQRDRERERWKENRMKELKNEVRQEGEIKEDGWTQKTRKER